MNALITGVSGQIGGYLVRELLARGYCVYGLMRGQDNPKIPLMKVGYPNLKIVSGDLLDYKSLVNAIEEAKPDCIFNLAAISFVPISWKQPELVFMVNALGPMKLLDAVLALGRKNTLFYQASSSEIFGRIPPPQSEESLMLPESPYAASKMAAHHICRIYRASFNLPIFCGISFNTESIDRPPIFVTRKITQAAAKISRGLQKDLVLGNLEARRDWQWAGDAVRAMVDLLEKAPPDDYVIATGVSHSVREFAEEAFKCVGLDYRDFVRTSREYLRPVDVHALEGDPSKIRNLLGWKHKISFEQLVRMMVEHDLSLLDS